MKWTAVFIYPLYIGQHEMDSSLYLSLMHRTTYNGHQSVYVLYVYDNMQWAVVFICPFYIEQHAIGSSLYLSLLYRAT